MAITAAGHQKMKDWLKNQLSHGTYVLNGTTHDMPIHTISLTGDVITIQFYLDDRVSGSITRFRVIDTSGAIWDDQPDSISKPAVNGLLVTFKYTLRRV
ncbi:hypothetical protein [Paenibacillus sp. L3-i20]|uniref:hypothetical protein n=1 Tax=Paenibacillus sp. L3-i20 TaxID=2905833 RepID=UPI001EDF105E|nr:hypothetical protein [Paenibacillus sp. L3-i20]GKU75649.1 hypothetical protein L3i20_v200460 [Paenibacillus sp. L3-i20]